MAVFVGLFGGLDGYFGDYADYDEWIVDTDGGHVKIDLIAYYYRDDVFNYSYFVSLSCKFNTDADYDAAWQEKQAERAEVDNDL